MSKLQSPAGKPALQAGREHHAPARRGKTSASELISELLLSQKRGRYPPPAIRLRILPAGSCQSRAAGWPAGPRARREGSIMTRNPTLCTRCHGRYPRRLTEVARDGRSDHDPPRTALHPGEKSPVVHSQTFPSMSHKFHALGAKDPTGAEMRNPSLTESIAGRHGGTAPEGSPQPNVGMTRSEWSARFANFEKSVSRPP